MDKVARFSQQERAELFQATADKLAMLPAVIEKDFWVCWVLKKIFEHPVLSHQLLFKGGTSLSKCFGLIERFSEDIDLILDWTLLTNENPYQDRSNTQQDKFNKAISGSAQTYVTDILRTQLEDLFGGMGSLISESATPPALLFRYPRAFDSDYIRSEILIEVGPMSAMVPKRNMAVKSYAAIEFAKLFDDADVPVRVIEPRKTFWDKITICHVEAHRPVSKATPSRYSRHYYDLYMMLNSRVKDDAMADLDLLTRVTEFKNKFYPQSWANYQAAIDGKFSLLPQAHIMKALRDDYEGMREMIHGEYPEFDAIMNAIALFEVELNEALAR